MTAIAMSFYTENYVNSKCTYVFTSASTALASFLYDRESNTQLTSVGSNDATPEVWTITFPVTRTISNIFLGNHNIKSGTIKYWDGAAYTTFSTPISLSGNSDTTHFFSFNAVATTKIQLTLNTTIVANAQKAVGNLFVFNLIGTFTRNAAAIIPSEHEIYDVLDLITGGVIKVAYGYKTRFRMQSSGVESSDIELIRTLKYRGIPFFFYPCGGNALTQRFFRLQDIYLVNMIGDSLEYNLPESHLTDSTYTLDYDLIEV